MKYLEQRLKALEITKERNNIRVFDPLLGSTYTAKYFEADKAGNIVINYFTPDGETVYYSDPDKATSANREGARQFTRTRYAPGNEPEDKNGKKMKYGQPKGSNVTPFFPPKVIEKYKYAVAGKPEGKIKTLIVTEGEFKAFSLDNFKTYCVGIGGISSYQNSTKDKINADLLAVVDKCNVENVVLLFDADCFEIHWKPGEEATTRPKTFRNAVFTFSDLMKTRPVTVYFARIKTAAKYKGIDDLLYPDGDGKANPEHENILRELMSLAEGKNARKFIDTDQVSNISNSRLNEIFALDNPENFYNRHIDILRDKDFIFNGLPYHATAAGKIERSWNGAEKQYCIIGTDVFKYIQKNEYDYELKKWSKSRIIEDFGKKIINHIPKFDDITNEPENDPAKYRRRITIEKDGFKTTLYNRYNKIEHSPTPGEWPNIEKLLHHIFDYANTSQTPLYDFILDWLKLTYESPKQHLPVLCLVSAENKTGKTTFLNLLKDIFCGNMKILDSDRISSQFNDSWAGSLIVAVDESLIDLEKINVKNKIKMIATNDFIPVEAKGRDSSLIENFSKLIMCSNDEANFMRIDIEENRYCVVKVQSLQGNEDPFLCQKMRAEIPAFLHFLKNREYTYQHETRLYFNEKIYETPQLLAVKERTKHPLKKAIEEVIEEQLFYAAQSFQADGNIKIPQKDFFRLVTNLYPRATAPAIKDYLQDKGVKLAGVTNFCWYADPFEGEEYPHPHTGKNRVYIFHAAEWLNDEKLREYYKYNPQN